MNRLLFILLLLPAIAGAQVPTLTGDATVQVSQGTEVWRASLNTLLSGRVGPDSAWVKLSGSYLNKRISDNLYRYGTVGLRTTDTTGILSIASKGQKKSIVVLNPDTSNTWIFSMENPYSNRPTWNHTAYWGGNGSGGVDTYPNLVMRLGSNVGPSSNQILSAPSFFDQWETNWWGTGIFGESALRNIYERHWIVIDSGNVQHRPLTGYFEKRAGGNGELAAYVSRFRLGDWNLGQSAIFSVNRSSESELASANIYNDSLYTVDTGSISSIAAAYFASTNKDGGGSVSGRGTGIVIGGKGSFSGYSAILGEYTTTNPNGNMDLIFTTQGNNSTGIQRKRMWIKSGASTTIGINNPSPTQALDILGSILVGGSARINMRADTPALTIKYQGTGITTPSLEWEFTNGTTAMYAHLYPYNATNSGANVNIVFGKSGTVHSLAAKNTVFGTTGAQFGSGIIGNSLFGYFAGNELNGGYNNTFFGTQAGEKTSTGFQNTFIGYFAGNANTTGYQNMFLGRRAGTTNLDGAVNCAIGTDALRLNISGSNNVAIGGQAGDAVIGSNNTIIGASAGRLVTGSGNILIGRQAAETQTAIDNQLYIENSNGSSPLIGGDFSTDKVTINLAPGSAARTLDVNGEVRIRDLTTDAPTLIVGADSDGDLASITVGTGLDLTAGVLTATGGGGVTDHGALTGLSDDDHTQYALLAGRSGGQILTGGTAGGDDLTLRSTTNATKGDILALDQGGNFVLGGAELQSELRFLEGAGGGTNYTAIKAPATQAANITLTLPIAAPTADGQVLSGTTSGTLSWVDRDAAPSVIRPAQLTAKTDNWNPSGYSTTREQTIELSGDGSFRCITGLEAATRDGVRKALYNSGATNCLVVAKQHPDSDADNRFGIPADVVLYPGMQATFRYDSVSALWRLQNTSISEVSFSDRTKLTVLYNGSSTTTEGYTFAANGGTNAVSGANSTTPTRSLYLFTSVATAFPTTYSKNPLIYLAQNAAYMKVSARVKTPQNLSDATNSYELRVGFETDVDTLHEEGAWIHYNHSENSGGWTIKTHNGSSITTTNAGSAIAANTWYNLEIVYYPYGEVAAWIDGTRYSTTSTLPDAIALYTIIQQDRDQGTSSITFTYLNLETETARVSETQ